MDVNMIKDKIESARTKNGGWTKETLQSLGVAWPPKKGWKKELIEKELREQIAQEIESHIDSDSEARAFTLAADIARGKND